MPTLTTTKTYADGDILFESDLDQIRTDIETFLNVTKIDDDNIQDSGITASTKLADASITAAKLGADSVVTAKILDSNVTTAKIADANVTAAKLASDAVTTAKILDANVTTAKLADGAVTQAKRASLGQQISSSSGTFSSTSLSYVDVTNLSVSITTTGRPVVITTISDPAVNGSYWAAGTRLIFISLLRDATEVAVSLVGQGDVRIGPTSIYHIDTPAAGTYTYKIQAKLNGAGTFFAYNLKLVAYEL